MDVGDSTGDRGNGVTFVDRGGVDIVVVLPRACPEHRNQRQCSVKDSPGYALTLVMAVYRWARSLKGDDKSKRTNIMKQASAQDQLVNKVNTDTEPLSPAFHVLPIIPSTTRPLGNE